MALSKPTDTLPEILGDLINTSVHCEADAGLSPLATKLDAMHDEIVQKSQARNRADDMVVRKLAAREVAFGGVSRMLLSWQKSVAAFCDDDVKRYATFFPATAKQMLGVPIGERARALEAPLEFARAGGYSGDLAAGAKKLTAAWSRYYGALGELEKADKAVRLAEAAVQASKEKACTLMREVHGRVQTAYPGDPRHVESFFRKRVPRKAAKPAPGTAPAGGTGQEAAK